jgi:hypothetical protein
MENVHDDFREIVAKKFSDKYLTYVKKARAICD